mgnify:CR=1 FL=1
MSEPKSTPDLLETIRAGYTFEGTALDLGAAVVDGQPHADTPVRVPLSVLNRHGLVAGATGTGKTKTLQLMAEQLSAQGVPVFLAYPEELRHSQRIKAFRDFVQEEIVAYRKNVAK